MLEWEAVESTGSHNHVGRVERARVPGGWLVMAYGWTEDYGHPTSCPLGLTFYPDPDHEWDGNSLPKDV